MAVDERLQTTFCGFELINPFLLASGPPAASASNIMRAFELGWAGAVTKTMISDPDDHVDVSPRFGSLSNKNGSVWAFENIELLSQRSVEEWVTDIKKIKARFPDRMLIASIMAAIEPEAWQSLARTMEECGADALELNFSCPHGLPEQGLGSVIGQNPELCETICGWVKESVEIPVIAKLSPNVTDITTVARAAERGGADALSAINTVRSLIGVNLNNFEPQPSVAGQSTFGGMSGPAIKPIGLRCVAEVSQACEVPVCGIGGIRTWQDAAEYMLVGANCVQICTEVMLHGFPIIKALNAGLHHYLIGKNLSNVGELQGKALTRLGSHQDLSRTTRVRPEIDHRSCNMCGLCLTACRDAGAEALYRSEGRIAIDIKKCHGCSLCNNFCDALMLLRTK